MRFEFDSSFVRPEVKDDMPALADLIERHTLTLFGPPEEKIPPPLSIFGHADPAGNDDYNKQLSGRRALAIYGMLVRDEKILENLFTQPFGGDQWGKIQIQTMLEAVGHSPGPINGVMGPKTAEAVKAFQSEKGLAVDGVVGPRTRQALYRAYMDFLCGPRLLLDREKNFLARHKDGDGLKGDVQGCGEFNPVLMFSQEENAKFEKATDKTERNQENAPNRRVMVLLFAPGRKVNPKFWPCPALKEGVAACKKRFFFDAEKRRTFQAKRREFENTKDTFACRFYQIISDDSPCERHVVVRERWIVRIDKQQRLQADDTVTLESKPVNYRSIIPARNAGDAGDFVDFLFLPGPETDYNITVTVGTRTYFAWKGLHLPGGGQGIESSGVRYAADEDQRTTYSRIPARAGGGPVFIA